MEDVSAPLNLGQSASSNNTQHSMAANFSMRSNQAYRDVLDVLEAGQRWFAFDVPIAVARNGEATRFGMTLWNYHRADDKSFEAWAITRDPASGTFWYRVGKEREGRATQPNRAPLWEALQIAASMPKPFPMNAVLKDAKTGRCAPEFVFGIAEVRVQEDSSALWLKLDVPGNDVGTPFAEQSLPDMAAVLAIQPPNRKRAGSLPIEHYLAIRHAATRINFEGGSRSEEILALTTDPGINEGTASALLGNFQCLLQGKAFKAPMQAAGLRLFIDAILARLGDAALPNLVSAVRGYIDYAISKWGAPAEMSVVLTELQRAVAQGAAVKTLFDAAQYAASAATGSTLPSEILREIWVRGPQHAAFRRELLRRWDGRCSVHGATCNDQLRASHIVAWSLDEGLRGDANNGLLLSVPLDGLFDRGLITFNGAGELIASHQLAADTAMHFGVRPGLRLAWDHLKDVEREAIRANLARHREQHKAAGLFK